MKTGREWREEGEMRDRECRDKERENGKGREEKEALPWQGQRRREKRKEGSGAPAGPLLPCPRTELHSLVLISAFHGGLGVTGCWLMLCHLCELQSDLCMETAAMRIDRPQKE